MCPVLEDAQDQAAGVFQLCEQEEVKVFVRFLLFLVLRMEKTDRLPAVQDQIRGSRAGEGERDLPQPFEFFDMSRIGAACPAERPLAATLQIKVAEIVFVQERASSGILAESSLFPVDLVFQAVSKRTFGLSVFFQGERINLDLPSRTACVRTFSGDACEFFIIMRYCILHVQITPFVQNTIINRSADILKSIREINFLRPCPLYLRAGGYIIVWENDEKEEKGWRIK